MSPRCTIDVGGLAYAVDQGGGGPIYAVGSSYSAALVIRLAAEHRLAGVAAFSPAPGLMGESEVKDWLPRASDVPVLILRPDRELANDWVAEQTEVVRELGVELFTAPDAAHGASMLNVQPLTPRSLPDGEGSWSTVRRVEAGDLPRRKTLAAFEVWCRGRAATPCALGAGR